MSAVTIYMSVFTILTANLQQQFKATLLYLLRRNVSVCCIAVDADKLSSSFPYK